MARCTDDEWNLEAPLEVHAALQHEAVITHHVAVVARENHDGVFSGAEVLECGQNLADTVIDSVWPPKNWSTFSVRDLSK